MGIRRLLRKNRESQLFGGNDSLFKSTLATCSHYGEYGCGESTIWVFENTTSLITSVDTSSEWCDKVTSRIRIADRERVQLQFCDCGPIENWGRPISFEKRKNFSEYINGLWSGKYSPDVVLVDGRFRVACFLTTLVRAQAGAHILFDDFLDRPQYALVTEYIRPVDSCGTQALFIVPEKSNLPIQIIEEEINRFCYVID